MLLAIGVAIWQLTISLFHFFLVPSLHTLCTETWFGHFSSSALASRAAEPSTVPALGFLSSRPWAAIRGSHGLAVLAAQKQTHAVNPLVEQRAPLPPTSPSSMLPTQVVRPPLVPVAVLDPTYFAPIVREVVSVPPEVHGRRTVLAAVVVASCTGDAVGAGQRTRAGSGQLLRASSPRGRGRRC